MSRPSWRPLKVPPPRRIGSPPLGHPVHDSEAVHVPPCLSWGVDRSRSVRGGRHLTVVTPAPRDAWRELLAVDRSATVFQTPEWLSCICDVEGAGDASLLYHTPSGRRLLLPLVRHRGLPGRLACEASLPRFWGTGGLVTEDGLHDEDMADIFSDLASRAGLLLSLRPYFTQGEAWEKARPPTFVRVPHLVHVLSLDGGFGDVWKKRFDRSARGGVRKAERMGVTIEVDTSGRLVPQFYDLYLRWHERRAREARTSPALARHLAERREPLHKFTLVAERLRSSCRAWVASHEGIPIAAVIALVTGDHAYYWRGFSDRNAAARTRANDLLQSRIIEDCCAAGCRYYNMGESGGVVSLMEFKQKFGAQPTSTLEFRYERLPFTAMQRWQDEVRRSAQRLLVAGESWRVGERPSSRT
jgi:Acetyltransferase (GNAT) domain